MSISIYLIGRSFNLYRLSMLLLYYRNLKFLSLRVRVGKIVNTVGRLEG